MMHSWKRNGTFLLILLAALALAPFTAQQVWAADKPSATSGSTSMQAQANPLASGTAGSCQWELDGEGTLTIGPGDYESSSPYSAFTTNDFDDKVKKVVFKATGANRVLIGATFPLMLSFPNMESVDLSGLDTSKAEVLSDLFTGCTSLESVDLSCLDTSNITNMEQLFLRCKSLKSVKLTGLVTSNAQAMNAMFQGCESLESVDLSGFDTSSLRSINLMFSDCTSLKHVNLSGFDTSHVTSMNHLFTNCKSLETINVSGFDTSKVERMHYMFKDCVSLKSIDLSNFKTSSVTSMDSMFEGCASLKTLDLSGFDGTSMTSGAASLVDGCVSLSSIILPKGLKIIDMPGTWKRSDGTTLAGDSFSSKYDPDTMYGEWYRVRNLSDYAISFVDANYASKSHVYNGKAYQPAVKVTGSEGAVITKGIDYDVRYVNCIDAGTAKAVVTGLGGMSGSKTLTFTIAKAPQSISAKNCKAAFAGKKSGGAKVLAAKKTVNLKKKAKVSAKTTVTYKKANKAGGKKITVNKNTGKVTLKKGLKKGTYKVKVKLTAKASNNYEKAKAKKITLTVKVK